MFDLNYRFSVCHLWHSPYLDVATGWAGSRIDEGASLQRRGGRGYPHNPSRAAHEGADNLAQGQTRH
jgi:hypothetical protein